MKSQRIILVHGTFANRTEDSGESWWQQGNKFSESLATNFNPECCVELDQAFHWSGLNSESARRKAGRKLHKRCLEFEKNNDIRGYHLIGHSHGGSVIWHAVRERKKLNKLKSVSTIGSPFLHSRPSWIGLLLLIPTLIALAFIWSSISDLRIFAAEFEMLQERGDWFAIWLLPILWVAVLSVFVVGIWQFLNFAWALVRWIVMNRRSKMLLSKNNLNWYSLVSTQDEAVNGLTTLARSSAPSFARRNVNQESNVVFRCIVSLMNRFLYFVDLFIWKVVLANAYGDDVRGETVSNISRSPWSNANSPWIPRQIDSKLIDSANESASHSIAQIRSGFGFAIADDISPEHAVKIISERVGSNVLIHTSYFDTEGFSELLARFVDTRRDPNTNTNTDSINTNTVLDNSSGNIRTSDLYLATIASLAVSAFALLASLNATSLYQTRVYTQTETYKIQNLIDSTSIDYAVEKQDIPAIVAWIESLKIVKGSDYSENVRRNVIKSVADHFDGVERQATEMSLKIVLTDQSSLLADQLIESEEIDWQLFEKVIGLLKANGYTELAKQQIDEVLEEVSYGDLSLEIVEYLLPIHMNLILDGAEGIEDIFAHSKSLAEMGDVESAQLLIEGAAAFGNEPYVSDFPEADDFVFLVGEESLGLMHSVASVRGFAKSEEFLSYIGIPESYVSVPLDSVETTTTDLHHLEIVTGLISNGDLEGAKTYLEKSRIISTYIYVEALGRLIVATNFGDKEYLEKLKTAASSLDGEMRLAALLIMFRCHTSQLPSNKALTDEAIDFVNQVDYVSSSIEKDLAKYWIFRRLLQEKRGELARSLAKKWASGSADFIDSSTITAERLADENRLNLAIESLWISLYGSTKAIPKLDDVFHISIDPSKNQNQRLKDAWAGRVSGLFGMAASNLEFVFSRCTEYFDNVDELLAAAEQVSDPATRAKLLVTLGNALSDRPADALLVWRRLRDMDQILVRKNNDLAFRVRGEAAIGLAESGDPKTSESLINNIDASAKLQTVAHLIRIYHQR